MQIVVRIGHVIGNGCDLRFGAGMGVEFKIPFGVHLGQRIGQGAGVLGIGVRAGHRAIVFGNAFKSTYKAGRRKELVIFLAPTIQPGQ